MEFFLVIAKIMLIALTICLLIEGIRVLRGIRKYNKRDEMSMKDINRRLDRMIKENEKERHKYL